MSKGPTSVRHKLSEEKVAEFVADHASGMSCESISKKHGVGRNTVTRALHKIGAPVRHCGDHNRKITPEISGIIVERIRNGDTILSLVEEFGVTDMAIHHHLRRIGLKTSHDKNKKHALNESAFVDAHKNPEACYWLGLLAADGCLMDKGIGGYVMAISLSGNDGKHLDGLRDFLGSSHHLSVTHRQSKLNTQPQTKLTVVSKKLGESLAEYGFTPRKSLTFHVDRRLESSPDFWRGMIDGDGSVHIRTDKTKRFQKATMGIVGSRDSIEQFAKFAARAAGSIARPARMRNIWRWETKGKPAIQLARLLYGTRESPRLPALPRKANTAYRFAEEFRESDARPIGAAVAVDHSWITRGILEETYEKFGHNWSKVCRQLGGMNPPSLVAVRERLGMEIRRQTKRRIKSR